MVSEVTTGGVCACLGRWQLQQQCVKLGRCGLGRPRVLAGEGSALGVVSRESATAPCGAAGNSRVDAAPRKQARCKANAARSDRDTRNQRQAVPAKPLR
jgi:hypothetical protein